MKKIICFSILLFSISPSKAQTPIVNADDLNKAEFKTNSSFGDVLYNDNHWVIIPIQGYGGGFTYYGLINGTSSPVPQLAKFDLKGNIVDIKEMKMELESGETNGKFKISTIAGENRLSIQKFFSFGDKYYAFALKHVSGKNSLSEVYVYELNIHSLEFTGTPKLLFSANDHYYSDYFLNEDLKYGMIDYAFSPDSGKMAFLIRTETEKNEAQKFKVIVFKNDFQKLYETDCELKQTNISFKMNNIFVDNNAVFSITGYEELDGIEKIESGEEKRSEYEKSKYAVTPHIICFTNEGKEMWDYKIEFPGTQTDGVNFMMNKSGHMVCAGFIWSEDKSACDKVFIRVLHPEDKTEVFKTENKIGRNVNFKIRNLIERTDDRYYIVAETYYNYMAGTSSTAHRVYYYGDNLIMSVNKNFVMEWFKTVAKKQYGNVGSLGYVCTEVDDKLHLILNAKEGSGDKENEAKNNTGWGGVPTDYIFNSDGSMKKIPFISPDADKVLLINNTKKIDDNHLFVGFRDNGYEVGKYSGYFGVIEIE